MPRTAVIGILAPVAIAACTRRDRHVEVTVAAASSLREVMPVLARAYEAKYPGRRVSATYAASGDLRKQVESGAPVDVVLFAGGRAVDDLVSEGLALKDTRLTVATNEIILVGRRGTRLSFATLTTLSPEERVAVGDPRTVPVGEYARDYLTTLGEWSALEGRVVFGASVAAVLAYARRGEVAAAIVYKTELHGVRDLVLLDEANGENAPRPGVVGAVVKGGPVAAAEFLTFVASPEGETQFASFGFGPP